MRMLQGACWAVGQARAPRSDMQPATGNHSSISDRAAGKKSIADMNVAEFPERAKPASPVLTIMQACRGSCEMHRAPVI